MQFYTVSLGQQMKLRTQIFIIALQWLLLPQLAEAGQVLKVYPTTNPSKHAQPVKSTSLKDVLNNYYGLSYAKLAYNNTGASSVSTSQILLHLGAHLSLSTAIEGRIGLLSTEAKVSYGSDSGKQKTGSFLGLYLRHAFFNFKGFEYYGLVGLTQTESQTVFVQNSLLYEQKKSSLDVSYGLGTRFRMGTTGITGNIEYNRLVTQTNYTLSSLNIGINVYF